MKTTGMVLAALLLSTAAIAADKPAAKPKPCPKGQVATISKITGNQVCFGMQGVVVGPMQPITKSAPAKKPANP